jgi:AcrR family transcriptional regulator
VPGQPGTIAGIPPPRQRRSRRARDRIVRVTLDLLAERPFEQISVAEIAMRARVAVGSIYNRFPSKDRLLLFIYESVVQEDLRASMEAIFTPRARRPDLAEFIFRFLWRVRTVFIRHRDIMRPLTLAGRHAADPTLQAFFREKNVAFHERLEQALLSYRDEIRHPRPRQAVQLAILWSAAAMREQFLYGQPVSSLARMGDRRFVRELAHGFVGYLTTPPQKEKR